jgi:competence protein ComEC
MASLFIGGNVLQRRGHPLNTLGVAGLVILAVAPLSLFDAGFQLSFAAVGAIVTLNPRLRGLIPARWHGSGWRGQLTALGITSVTATLGTMPVLLTHFGYVSFGGIVLNIVAIPLTASALMSGMVTVALGGWTLIGSTFGAASGMLTSGLLGTARLGEEWLRWASIEGFIQGPWTTFALIATLSMAVQWPRPRLRWRLAATALFFAGVGIWVSAWDQLGPPPLEVVFLDVGQGDAAVVSFPNGRHMLVDAGARSPHFDAGASFVLPHLDRHGIDRLDAVVISHSDSDHLGGLPTILRHVPVERIILNDQEPDTGLIREVARLVDSLHVPIQRAWAGDTLSLDAGVYMQVLSPLKEAFPGVSDNDASIVLRLVYGTTRILFTGDIETSAEHWLARHYGGLLQSEIVKVGHHGSRTSSQKFFVEQAATRGGAAVISVGMRNRFGFPAPEVVQRWQSAEMRVMLTARRGAVWFRSDGNRVTLVPWR